MSGPAPPGPAHPFIWADGNECGGPSGAASQLSWTGICRELEERLFEVSSLMERIEAEMESLSRRYRETTPRSALQLFVRRAHRESPPISLYWGRLCRRPSDFETGPGWKRWHRKLRIRTRQNLQTAIYFFSGLPRGSQEILRYFDRVWALNRARGVLAHSIGRAKVLVRESWLWGMDPEAGSSSAPALARAEDPIRWGREASLLHPARRIEGFVEAGLESMMQASLRIERLEAGVALVSELGRDPYGRWSWLLIGDGTLHRKLEPVLDRGAGQSPGVLEELRRTDRHRTFVYSLLRSCLRTYHAIRDLLLRGLIQAHEALRSCPRLDG